jgi:hypothetical protein
MALEMGSVLTRNVRQAEAVWRVVYRVSPSMALASFTRCCESVTPSVT